MMIGSVVWTSGPACILMKLDTQDRHRHWELSPRLNCPRPGSRSPPLRLLSPSTGARHWPSTKAEVPARYHRVESCTFWILGFVSRATAVNIELIKEACYERVLYGRG